MNDEDNMPIEPPEGEEPDIFDPPIVESPKVETPEVEKPVETQKPVPQFSPEGVLLNPHECHVSNEGIVTAKP